ncbi:MAG: hypothetical protein GY858_01260 [Candidatus Omnitrophica bacterium]|nr:hypothetical protein [Candidatus Omnitrophota bacterium]
MSEDQLKQECSQEEIKEGAPFAALSYVFFLWIFAFTYKKNNNFALFHARQGLVLFFLKLFCLVAPVLPFISRGLSNVAMLVLVAASFYGVYNALTGKSKQIPLVTKIAAKLVI